MNWLDIIIIGLLLFGALRGLRIGLIGALLNAVALILAWLFGGQIASLVAQTIPFALPGYAISILFFAVIALALIAAQLLWKALRGPAGMATLGLSSAVDRIGGLLLGTIIGLALSAVLLLALARLTYSLPAYGVLDRVNINVGVENALAESAAARVFVTGVNALPASALGLVPGGFAEPLDMLERRL